MNPRARLPSKHAKEPLMTLSLRHLLARPALGASLALGLLLAPAATAQDKKDDKEEAPKEDDKKRKEGPAQKGDYEVDTSATSPEIKVNGDGKLSIHIKPIEGMKVHPQAPLEVRLTPSEGLKPARSKLGRKQVTDPEATAPELTCDLHAETAGDHKVEAELTFYLCSETRCDRMKDKVVVAVKAVP